MFTGSMGRVAAFCSYAREDEAIRASIERALAPLRDEHVLDDWYDNRVNPGARWNNEIQAALDRARLMLFIITPDLIASRYVAEVEIPKALERELHGECRVVPIMARKVAWESSDLAQFQALPGDGLWLDEMADADSALVGIAAGIREVCRSIIDWENPYKRTKVGDWLHAEHTSIFDNGRSLTGEGTEEVIAKTADEATIAVEFAVGGQLRHHTMRIPLDQPLEDRVADMMSQSGTPVPGNLEFAMSPAQYGSEVVNIGGRRYDTIRTTRTMRFTQRGHLTEGHATNWRSVDVPLSGIVKGEGFLPGMRQYQVLLGFGHGDAATAKPRLANGSAQGSHQSGLPPTALIVPGRWQIQMNALGMTTSFDLSLYPDGNFRGCQYMMGMPVQRQGRWFFDPSTNVLGFQVIATIMGAPVVEDVIQMQISGTYGPALCAQDTIGRQFQLQRLA